MPGAQLAVDAVRADAWTIVDRLLEGQSNAVATVIDDDGNTLLHLAAFCGASHSAHILLRHGADSSLLNAHEQSATDLAFLSGHHAIVELLRDGVGDGSVRVASTSLAGQTEATSEAAVSQTELTLGALPQEMHVRILRCLEIGDVMSCAAACRRFSRALDDRWLWESLCWSHFKCDSLQATRGLCTWKDVYREHYLCHRAQLRHREQRDRPKGADAHRRAGPDHFCTPRIVPAMATSIEELFEPLPM